jgi:hypothetical protein
VAEGPANAKKFQQNRNHRLSKIARAAVVTDGFLKVLHLLQVVLLMFWVDATIPVLRIAMVTNRELGILEKVPEKPVSPQQQADTKGPVRRSQAKQEENQPPRLARFIADIEVLTLTDGTHVDYITLPIRIAIKQNQLSLATRARDQPFVPRWTRLAFSKAMAAMKENLYVVFIRH